MIEHLPYTNFHDLNTDWIIAAVKAGIITSATAVTLPSGAAATASFANGVLTIGVPKGDKGDTGAQGAPGAPGAPGQDYVLTEQDKQDIAFIIESDLNGNYTYY